MERRRKYVESSFSNKCDRSYNAGYSLCLGPPENEQYKSQNKKFRSYSEEK